MADVYVVGESEAGNVAEFGGKAAALSRLLAAGFDVPPFVAISTKAFSTDGICRDARDQLARHIATLGPGPFAVRSSGQEEDGSVHSHAGQFLSLLEVAAVDVPPAALKVWQSGDTDGIRAYRTTRGLAIGSAPAVIVQRLVRARASGVAFSADPVSGRRDRLLVSATAGLGDQLVSGAANGDDYVIDRSDGAVVARPERSGVITESDLAAVARLAIAVEATFGRPQDIEWAFEGDRLFLLQARPITTALRAAIVGDDAVTIFDNSNIVESYPGLVSPLTYSFAQYAYAHVYRTFVALLGVSDASIRANGAVFENMLGSIDGRVYYNLVNWYRALAMLPGFALNRGYMETMMGVGEPLPAEIGAAIGPPPAAGWARVGEYGRVGKMSLRLIGAALQLQGTMRDFQKRLDGALAKNEGEIDAMPLTALAAEYRRVESELLERWDAPLINDFLCMIAFGGSRKLVVRWGGSAGLEVHNEIMIGQGDIVSAEPAQRIAEMALIAAEDPKMIASLANGNRAALSGNPALAHAVDTYLAKFGDRCIEELKLESITLREDPTPLLAAIAAASRTVRQPRSRMTDADDPVDKLFSGKPFRRFVVRRAMAIARARVRDRENLRFERTRIFGRARYIFVAIGRQLHARDAIGDPRDVFYLTVPEVLGAIEGFGANADLMKLAALRKSEMAGASERPNPPERIQIAGAAIGSASRRVTPTGEAKEIGNVRTGTGCCSGVVRARVRVVRDPRRETVEWGEILIARSTDPGWIALFASAAAIVVERGSLLSHSAIVARELGIPCVVALKGVMDWLATGDLVEVDGATGTVTKLNG